MTETCLCFKFIIFTLAADFPKISLFDATDFVHRRRSTYQCDVVVKRHFGKTNVLIGTCNVDWRHVMTTAVERNGRVD